MLNEWIVLFRLVLAAVLSGIIGFEREFHGRAAGFRTHILLCIGSTLVMLTSIHIFDIYNSRVPCDPARIAAGVVTGIGFLGAGTIMHFKASVRGLTTAASLWVVAGLGLAIGSGLYFGSVVTTIISIVTLFLFSRFKRTVIRKYWHKNIVITAREGVDQLKSIRDLIGEYGVDITDFEVGHTDDRIDMKVKLSLRLTSLDQNDDLVHEMSSLEGVKSVKWDVS